MIRSIDIHTGHTTFDSDVVVLPDVACVLRVHIGGATVNIFGDVDRQGDIRRAAAALKSAFDELESMREAAE